MTDGFVKCVMLFVWHVPCHVCDSVSVMCGVLCRVLFAMRNKLFVM